MAHRCPVTTPAGQCTVPDVPAGQLMCSTHWSMVPSMLQHELYRAWARGSGAGTEHHEAAMVACVQVVNERLAPPVEQQLFDPPPAVVPPGYDTAPCRHPDGGCKALVIWATQVDGYGKTKYHEGGPRKGKPKRIPLNMRPHPDGHWRLTGGGKAQLITRGEIVAGREKYQAHHATCTALAAQRKRGRFTVHQGGRV